MGIRRIGKRQNGKNKAKWEYGEMEKGEMGQLP
jgi:hypothetical protein